nr:unnamed protein product [Spirometra erinaceieuropaei]
MRVPSHREKFANTVGDYAPLMISSDNVQGKSARPPPVTTIFAADEDIKKGQLDVFLFLHCKLDVREDGVEMFFEFHYPIPSDDDEGIINIPSPELRFLRRWKSSDSNRCRTASAMSPEIGEANGVPLICSPIVPSNVT